MEIGPGRGALTVPLLDRGVRVLAFEIDPPLAARLSADHSERTLFVETQDALRADVGAGDLMRTLIGMCYLNDRQGWRESVAKMMGVLLDGMRLKA